ncbi:hypothetical protein LTS01_026149, partial [Friedmanniomyces endolithicus]
GCRGDQEELRAGRHQDPRGLTGGLRLLPGSDPARRAAGRRLEQAPRLLHLRAPGSRGRVQAAHERRDARGLDQ